MKLVAKRITRMEWNETENVQYSCQEDELREIYFNMWRISWEWFRYRLEYSRKFE